MFIDEIGDILKPLKFYYNTISTIIRNLKKRVFLEVFDKTFRYGPAITRQKYGNMFINELLVKYFGGLYR